MGIPKAGFWGIGSRSSPVALSSPCDISHLVADRGPFGRGSQPPNNFVVVCATRDPSPEWAVQALCPQSWIVRTAWLYGANGPNFVKTMARLAAERDTVSVVDDQRGQPTWTVDLAHAIVRLVEAEAPFGSYHGTSSGETTWFDLTQEIFRLLGLDPARVLPTTSDAFVRPAPRPAYSVLGHDAWQRAGVAPIREWSDALAESITAVVGAAR